MKQVKHTCRHAHKWAGTEGTRGQCYAGTELLREQTQVSSNNGCLTSRYPLGWLYIYIYILYILPDALTESFFVGGVLCNLTTSYSVNGNSLQATEGKNKAKVSQF